MQYVHYWHFQKAWYANITESTNPEAIYWHNSARIQSLWNEKYLIKGSEWMTQREIKTKLMEMYPNCILIKDKPFHEGKRWNRHKHGSRN